ncbi:hypothetical protein RHGRI_034818 [Rhododendron griersonianum]|uniref:Uncharacterized protein n=1 Tax=Rhododendron griersonianum TaxID=479676 RepID=A0AAV6I2K8_9ERIC|nr:hypothetical protein RHGRI_034818 [Rhododendron griersonianum]
MSIETNKHLGSGSTNVEEDEEACAYALHLTLCYTLPIVLNAAVELELFDIIARAGCGARLSASEIAFELPTKDTAKSASMLDSMLQLLACNSLLACSIRMGEEDGVSERIYGLSPAGKYFVQNGGGGSSSGSSSVAPFLRLVYHPASREAWFHLKDAVLEGSTPFERVHGMSPFEYIKTDPKFHSVLVAAMAGISNVVMGRILRVYKGFDGLRSLVDVGGGIGKTLSMILSIHPSIKSINFDLPHVIKSAPSYPGIEHVEGDMFSSIPKGDAALLKSVLHDWGDEHCLKVLKNCYKALPKDGKVIIIELVKPEVPDSSIAAKYGIENDNNMLVHTGGRERTEKEFQALCMGSGFSNYQIICRACSVCVIEFYK